MDSILVTPDNLRSKAKEVDSKASDYYTHYKGLLTDVEELTSSDFTGDAANAFRQKVQAFEADFNKMKELMEQYASFLRNAADNYDRAQEDVKNSVAGAR